MTINLSPLARRMIDTFNAYATDCDPDDAYELTNDAILDHDLTITRCDFNDHAAMLHLTLDDELHDLLLFATFDRDSMHLSHMTIIADATATPIDRIDFYQT